MNFRSDYREFQQSQFAAEVEEARSRMLAATAHVCPDRPGSTTIDERDSGICEMCQQPIFDNCVAGCLKEWVDNGGHYHEHVVCPNALALVRDRELAREVRGKAQAWPIPRRLFHARIDRPPQVVNDNGFYAETYTACRTWLDSCLLPMGGTLWSCLALRGVYGCGKTWLAAALANHCRDLNRPVAWATTADLLAAIQATFKDRNDINAQQLVDAAVEADMLVLDDYGKHKTSEWSDDMLYQIINRRYEAERPIITTMNPNAKSADSQDVADAIRSRISEQVALFNFPTFDLRRKD